MPERIPKSIAKLVVFRAVLASDGKTAATGKTIPITISKNGATSFSNPAAGATNATEMAGGFYKFTLAAGDVDTVGPLAWKGAEGTIVDVGDVFTVEGDVTIAGQLIIQDGIDVSCTTSNRNAIRAIGNGTGSALWLQAGAGGFHTVYVVNSFGNGLTISAGSVALGLSGDTGSIDMTASSGNVINFATNSPYKGIDLSTIDVGIDSVLSEDLLNSIADTILRRLMANVESSTDGDTLGEASLYGLVQRVSKSSTLAHANKLTIYQTNGITELAQIPTAADTAADPITKVGV